MVAYVHTGDSTHPGELAQLEWWVELPRWRREQLRRWLGRRRWRGWAVLSNKKRVDAQF